MLKMKLQYFGHLMRRVDSLEKTDAGRDWGQEEKGTAEDEMAGWTWVWVDSRGWWWTGRPVVLRFTGLQRVGHDWVTELNWINTHLYLSVVWEFLFFFYCWLLFCSMDKPQFINFPVEGPDDRFLLLVIMHKNAMNIQSIKFSTQLDKYLGAQLLDHMVRVCLFL